MSTATISCSTPDAIIRYEIGGVDPTESSPLYSSPVEFSGEIRAKAWKEGMIESDIAVAVTGGEDMAYYRNEIQLTNITVDPSYSFDCNVSSEDYNRLVTGRYDCFLIMKASSSEDVNMTMKHIPVTIQINMMPSGNAMGMVFSYGSYKANIMITNNHATFSNDYAEIFSDFMMYTQAGYGGTAYMVIQGYESAS